MAVRGDNSLFFATGIDNSGLLKGKTDAVNIIQSLGSKISKINPFAALAVGAIAAFTLIANEGYKMSKAFESAMAEVKTIANVSEKDFKKLEENVFGIYKRLGTEPPDKLAQGLYEIIGAGFEAGDALNILEISSKAATAGVTETAVAADGLTTVLNAFKLTTGDAQEVADIMFATVDRGKISFEELSSQIATVAPLAASSNISFQEVGAAISTLTKQGVPASVAMTQIRSAIIATNEVLGDGAFKTLTLQQGLQKMYESAGGSQNQLKELAGRIEAVNAIIGIAGDNFKGASEDLDAMANSAGSVDRSFKTITSTNANQWEIFRNRIKATTKGIGDAVLDMSNDIVGGLNRMIDGNESVVDSLKEHKRKLNDLTFEYNDHNTSAERRKEILGELKKLNPAIVSGLGTEKDQYVLLNDKLQDYNSLLNNRISLEKELNNIAELNAEKDEKKESIYNLESKADKAIKDINNEFRNGNIKFYDDWAKKFEEALKGDFDNSFLKLKSLTEILYSDRNNTDQRTKNRNITTRIQRDNFGDVGGAKGSFVRYNKEVQELSKSIDAEQSKIDAKRLYDLRGKEDYVLKLLKSYKNLDKVSREIGVDVSLVKDSDVKKEVAFIKATNAEIKKITSINNDAYKKDRNIFKEYLNSKNEDIKEAAKKQKAYLDFKPNPTPKKDDRTAAEKFADDLKIKEEQYKHYNLALKNEDLEFAKKLKENYKLKEEDYITYLRNLYKISQSDGSKSLILQSLDKQGTGLTPRKKVENKKLEAAESHLKKEEDLYKGLNRTINSLSFQELRKRISDKKNELREKLKDEKKYAKEILKLRGEIEEAQESLGDKIQNTANDIAGIFSQVGSLFRKFGDEDTAQLLDQLSGVAEGIGKMASGNPLDIISGGLQILESALTVEVVSDTAKFEAAIKELEKAIDKLDYVISKSIGTDRIDNRRDAIEKQKELQTDIENARKAEEAARKEVKFLGIGLWKKGSGSGTDPAKLEELEQKAEAARRKAQELKEQLDELYTGTTQTTIVDSIISGLKEGKRSIADFADNFKELMQDAMLQAFQIKYLEDAIKVFYDEFALAGEDSNYTAEEISALQNLYNSMISGAQDDIDAINAILESSGIGSLGSENGASGLAGAVSTITEDSANIIAGTLNSIRIDIATGLDIAQRNTIFLSQIVTNTSYNKLLEKMDITLTNIDSKL
ncbi:phage tail tape measure protein [Tenacibaculum maritimum]|nr:phage tail tape measure protein [Tenacibaculum maritimum]MDB0602365.1 phage tail tape measure protein [Tenacibaculum maritimum]MDB0613474.1 phage tail tape measure protein [Tenacibaculum maritimum]